MPTRFKSYDQRKESGGISMSSGFSSKVPDCVVKDCYEYEGVIMPNIMRKDVIDRVREFECRPDDLFIVTYPKSGTTWVEHLCMLIEHDGDASQQEGAHLMMKVPFLEFLQDMLNIATSPTFIDLAEKMPSPRILKSHCQPPFLPPGIRTDDPKAKVKIN
ncbi:sulfotransferase 1C1-like [Lytechinus pictus]|uniref:sulfotransferase 1C1-like n=1 Tax=Lytechinus pictus TaxID=7653 RepID=UPI0030B9CD5C